VFCTVFASMPPADMPTLLSRFQLGMNGPMDQRADAMNYVMKYVADYLQGRADAAPAGDVVDAILQCRGEDYSFTAAVGTLAQLVQGGIATTGYVITGGLYHFATHPEDRARVIDDPSLLPKAVEEFLRYFASAAHSGRRATKDTEVAGQPIKKGDWVLLANGTANRDPANYPDPLVVDIERTPNHHIAFGAGIHTCIGAYLARRDIRIALETFLRRIPDFELAEGFVPKYQTGCTREILSLPLRFTPSA
jgi:cytochrome P450